MPQASDDLRALMAQWFPRSFNGNPNNGVDDGVVWAFLISHGWTEHGGLWRKPTPSYNPSMYEIECLRFLRDEWDYDWERPLFQPSPIEPPPGE